MSEPPAPSTVDDAGQQRIARRFVMFPLLAGVVLLAAAVAWVLVTEDLGIVALLLMLLGGVGIAMAFVNATTAMRPARNGVVLHVGVAVVLSAAMYVAIRYDDAVRALVPTELYPVLLVVQIAAAPATAWIWLALFGRVTARVGRKSAAQRAARTPPTWHRDENGDGSFVTFHALPLRMRTLTVFIVAVVLVVGLAAAALLIAFDDIVMRMSPMLAIVIVGVVLGLPAYLLLTAVLRRRTLTCVVAFGAKELRVRVGEQNHRIPLAALDLLVWRPRSDYARVEIAAPGVALSLISGIATPPAGKTAELPALPRRVEALLAAAGLVAESSRNGEVVTYRRIG